MAVAVKHSPETASTSPFDRLPVLSLVGVIYVLGCLGVVFGALPKVWGMLWADSFPSLTFRALAMVAVAAALLALGARLIGPKAVPGLKAGIFVGLVGVLLLVLLTRGASIVIENQIYDHEWFGDAGKTYGIALTAAVGVLLLVIGIHLFTRPATERALIRFEQQGWFEAAAYKRQQGLRVRRATILGILLIVGAGIYTLISHGMLSRGSPNWELNIPFTGQVTIDKPYAAGKEGKRVEGYQILADGKTIVDKEGHPVSEGKVVDPAGDTRPFLAANYPDAGNPVHGQAILLDRFQLRDLNKNVDRREFVKLVYANDASSLKESEGKLIRRADFDEVKNTMLKAFNEEHKGLDEATFKTLKDDFEKNRLPKAVDPTPASGPLSYQSLTLLPSVQYTVPVLLMAAALWLAWRVVNMPTFADFLIATEAELNKVSWTTGKRLRQDTIVVLITVILMAVYLFSMDQAWRWLLSRKIIGTLQFPEDQSEVDKSVEQKPW
jgi:preprotein translocase SecE subunit